MKKKALKKDFRTEIKKSRNRFFSIFFIVAMGVAFFSGIHASAPDMRATGDYYFDQGNLMDLRVISTLGITEEDLTAIRALEGVGQVYGSYMEDVYCQEEESQEVLHFEALQDGVNGLTVKEGRLPEKTGECFLDADYATAFGYETGDILEVQVESEEDTMLVRQSFTVCGYGYSPCYVSFMRGSTTLGTGSLSGFVYILPEEFDSEVYSVAYLHVEGAKDAIEFTEEYDALVDAVYDRLDGISDLRCQIRYDEVMENAKSEIADAKQKVAEGKQELADAKAELEEGKEEAESELAKAESELTQGESELEEGRQEAADAKDELSDAQAQIAEGEQEIAENAQTLADARTQLGKGEKELGEAEKEYKEGLAEFERSEPEARKKLANAQAEIDTGKKQIEEGWKEYNKNLAALKSGEEQLLAAEEKLTAGQAAYDAEYPETKAKLDAAWQEYEAGMTELAEGQAAYDAGAAEAAEGQAAYEAAAAETAQARAVCEKGRTELAEGQAAYEAGAAELAAGQAAYEAALTQQQKAKAACEAGRAQLDASWDTYREKKAAADAAQEALEAARGQADQLETEYNEAKGRLETLQAEEASRQAQVTRLEEEIRALEESADLSLEQTQLLETRRAELADARSGLTACQGEIQAQEQLYQEAQEAWTNAAAEVDTKQQTAAAVLAEAETMRQSLEKTEAELTGQQAALDAAATELSQTKQELEKTGTELNHAKQELDEKQELLAATEQELTAAETVLAEQKKELEAAQKTLAASAQEIAAAQAELAAARKQIEEGYGQLEATAEELNKGRAQLVSQKQELASGQEELEKARIQLEASEQELEEGQEKVDTGYAELDAARTKLESARSELNLGWAQLNASRKQVTAGERQLEEGRSQLASARTELEDGLRQIREAEEEIARNEDKIRDGWKDYEEGKKEAEEEIADGEQKIADAQKELLEAEQKIADAQETINDIKFTKWYIDDRSVLPEHTGFGENADRLTNIAQVFPALFFLVAALISLTTMTRMVEEERIQIGTLKAIGYSKRDIASKYLKYAFLATLGGSIFGVLFGEKLFPWVIITAYGTMYTYLPRILLPYNWSYGLAASAAALLCTMGATVSACYRALQTVPAQLMRPPAPKAGKRVLLEYVPFVWHRLNFTWKSTVRNLLRYKKRFLMTIIGIGGCMGLLLVGYGLKDSIMDIAVLQYSELQKYDAMVILDTDLAQRKQQAVLQTVEQDERVVRYKRFYMQNEKVVRPDDEPGKEWSVYLYVPENMEEISEFLCFRDRRSGEEYTLTDKGAILTEKLAKEFDIQAGDAIILAREDGEDVTIPVAAVCENYLSHYLYLTPALYEEIYGEAPEYNSIFFTSEESQAVVEDVGKTLLENDAVLNITYTRTLKGQIDDMLVALNSVMVVIIAAAGALAFVVLYNLNNININERRRELATLKVLGFYDGEVSAYVYRENILLTVIGAGLGCIIGKILHQFIIVTVEVDACMFGRVIKPTSFLIATLFTFGFSFLVNVVMHYKLKKIDMVESLKSIE